MTLQEMGPAAVIISHTLTCSSISAMKAANASLVFFHYSDGTRLTQIVFDAAMPGIVPTQPYSGKTRNSDSPKQPMHRSRRSLYTAREQEHTLAGGHCAVRSYRHEPGAMICRPALLTSILCLALCVTAYPADPLLVSGRLDTPVATHISRKGDPVRATVIAPVVADGMLLAPAGSVFYGAVAGVRSVGLGLRRERAHLDIAFDRMEMPDGSSYPVKAVLAAVDNAREEVDPNGRIRGVLAAGGTPALMRGVWRIPSRALLSRPLGGITGFAGRFWTHSLGPIGCAGVLAFRWAAMRFPEPEILFPAGTEVTLAVPEWPRDAPAVAAAGMARESSALGARLAMADARVTRTSGKPVDDIVNVALAGSAEEIASAFRAAGWNTADPLNRATFARLYRAYVSQSGYPTAPVSQLHYQGRPPDLVFQKSLNTVEKRHHIRIWQIDANLWVGAATHDVGTGYALQPQLMTHLIDPDLDRERSKVISDLALSDCAGQVTLVNRGALAVESPQIRTDGALALIRLQACQAPAAVAGTRPGKPGTVISRFVRRTVLETKQYLLRDNAYHWGYRGVVAAGRKLARRKPASPPDEGTKAASAAGLVSSFD